MTGCSLVFWSVTDILGQLPIHRCAVILEMSLNVSHLGSGHGCIRVSPVGGNPWRDCWEGVSREQSEVILSFKLILVSWCFVVVVSGGFFFNLVCLTFSNIIRLNIP